MSELAQTTVSGRGERFGVTSAYVAQGLSYATVVTALPVFKLQYELEDDTVSLILLAVVLSAAAGSWIADLAAIRWGSRAALVTGLALQAAALAAIAWGLPFAVFWAMFVIYGLGLGMVDASAAMQGVIVQRRLGKAVMGSFFAAATAASIVGALAMSGGATIHVGASLGLGLAGFVAAAAAIVGIRLFDPTMERAELSHGQNRPGLPRAGILVFGFIIFAAFTADSTVATWSTVYLKDWLNASAAIAPLGYAVYAAFTLITRLVADAVVRKWGRAPLAVVAATVAVVGLGLAGAISAPASAIIGFALAGMGVGALVPLAFSAAGDLDPRRGDEIIARVNLFNYAGSLLGAVLPGLLAEAVGMRGSFLIAAVVVAPVLIAVRSFTMVSAPKA